MTNTAKKKLNFVVSMTTELWESDALQIFAIDRVIEHKYLNRNPKYPYKTIEVAPSLRSSAADVRRDREYIESIHEKFIEVVIARLIEIHGHKVSNLFWRKAIAKSILRHLSLCFDLFQVCEKSYNPEKYTSNTLPASNFRVPKDFTEHRFYFQDNELGREQLFSNYCEFRYPHIKSSKQIHFQTQNLIGELGCMQIKPPFFNLVIALGAMKNFVKEILLKKGANLDAQMLIIDTSISDIHLQNLVKKSFGRIIKVDLPDSNIYPKKINKKIRSNFSRHSNQLDDFGNYCLKVLEYGMPTIFIEDFSRTFKTYNKFFEKNYPNTKFVVCEWWIGFSKSSFAMAVLNERKVKHISVEHNCISHIFEGVPTKFFYPLVDEYLTLGWSDSNNFKIVPGGSMYPWTESDIKVQKDIDCLVILGAPIAYIPEISPAYGLNGQLGVELYIEMINSFFNSLALSVLERISIRGYPLRDGEVWMVWDQKIIFANHIGAVKAYDDSVKTNSKELMQRSRIIVVTYLSTAHLEAFMANIPTIVLWNKEAYSLDINHQYYFEELIAVGVCQTNWVSAAEFLSANINNPEAWWMSEVVQEAKNRFLERNINTPEHLFKLLLDKLY
jgi:putative transferase (TIGR04331 family)